MGVRVGAILVGAVLCLAPTASFADLAPYSQDFEGLTQDDTTALAYDGWWAFANVFVYPAAPNWWWVYSYNHPAPNWGPPWGFSTIGAGEGGPQQGEQQLVIFGDYNNGDQSWASIESNVYQTQYVGAADVGKIMRFEFDAKRGDIAGESTAAAFIKAFDTSWNLIHFPQVNTTDLPVTWGSYMIEVEITPDLVGGALQFGFLNWTHDWEPSGVVYDNINFDVAPVAVSVDVKPGSCPNPINFNSTGDLSVAILGTADLDVSTIDPASIRLAGVAPLRSNYEDVGTPFEPYLGREDCEYDCLEMEGDGWMDLTFKFDTQEVAAALGDVQDGECLVVGLTGEFWPAYGGGRIEGEDVVVILDRAATTRMPTARMGQWVMPGDVTEQPIRPRN
jgi:hypothetical protein